MASTRLLLLAAPARLGLGTDQNRRPELTEMFVRAPPPGEPIVTVPFCPNSPDQGAQRSLGSAAWAD
jgi:hypothetical protein